MPSNVPKINLESIGNEHECPDCGAVCFCDLQGNSILSCVHACEMNEDVYDDYEDEAHNEFGDFYA